MAETLGSSLVEAQHGQPCQQGVGRLQKGMAGLCRQCLQSIERDGTFQIQVADAGASQRGQVAAAAQNLADILSERANVGSLAATYIEL